MRSAHLTAQRLLVEHELASMKGIGHPKFNYVPLAQHYLAIERENALYRAALEDLPLLTMQKRATAAKKKGEERIPCFFSIEFVEKVLAALGEPQ